jgi:hypothetical protein
MRLTVIRDTAVGGGALRQDYSVVDLLRWDDDTGRRSGIERGSAHFFSTGRDLSREEVAEMELVKQCRRVCAGFLGMAAQVEGFQSSRWYGWRVREKKKKEKSKSIFSQRRVTSVIPVKKNKNGRRTRRCSAKSLRRLVYGQYRQESEGKPT